MNKAKKIRLGIGLLIVCALATVAYVKFAHPTFYYGPKFKSKAERDWAAQQKQKAAQKAQAYATQLKNWQGGKPACAVLIEADPQSELQLIGVFLLAKLSENPKLRTVERAQIDLILREQHLSAAFGPDGGPDRIKLGQILQADVLALMRPGQTGARQLDLVVCETRRGLRLLVQTLTLREDPEAAVDPVAAKIDLAVTRATNPIADICAVPPFISNDLSREYDHLRTGYAKVIERAFSNHRRLLIVEFEEAEAIAREVQLTSETMAVQRRLPIYIMGEYRHSGTPTDRRVSFNITLQRGSTQLASRESEQLSPDQATAFLHQQVAAMIDQALGKDAFMLDPLAETRQLWARAKRDEALGNWAEAMDLH